jgi:hypothetical protein
MNEILVGKPPPIGFKKKLRFRAQFLSQAPEPISCFWKKYVHGELPVILTLLVRELKHLKVVVRRNILIISAGHERCLN